jgi:peroxiredoxin Q/BCP
MVAGILLSGAFSLESFGAELKTGEAAPEFKLPGSDGKTYQLSQFKGEQPVVIAFYPKAFTGG